MSEDAGKLAGFAMGGGSVRVHEERNTVLGELHARPFSALPTPAQVYHFAFVTDADEANLSRERVSALAAARGQVPPPPEARFHRVTVGPWTLRWERHNEFTSYTWISAQDAGQPFASPLALDFGAGSAMQPPGKLLVAVRLGLIEGEIDTGRLESHFDRSSLAVILAVEGGARVATDFQVDANGFTRVLVENLALTDTRVGRLVQRVLELETYRTLALLGLPVARHADGIVQRIETQLGELTRAISTTQTVGENRQLLTRLTGLAAELEALRAETSYRFGASRAYEAIVKSRITAIREQEHPAYVSWSRFLGRRFKPAMETCRVMTKRQRELSVKLARTTELLSTTIQFDLEQQNRSLLQSMNRRARLALRLQQTVEGLSIAAISYYVVGLVGYIAKAAKAAGLLGSTITPDFISGVAVPFVIGGLWLLLHRARQNWRKEGDE